jgi:hypothetical protein
MYVLAHGLAFWDGNFFIGNELISGMEPPAGCLQAASALANTYSTSKQ